MTGGAGETAAAPRISFVTTCKGRLAQLRQSLPYEVMDGWGYEDIDFNFRLAMIGRVQHALPAACIRLLDHGNAERTRFCSDQLLWRNLLTNAWYAQVKHDLMRYLGNANLSLALRTDIYHRVAAALGGAGSPEDCRVGLTVTLPPGLAEQFNPNRHIRRTVNCVLEPRQAATTPRNHGGG